MPKIGIQRAAEKGIAAKTIYDQKDPVSGKSRFVVRKPTTHASSKRLLEFRDCVKQGMTGYEAPDGTPKQRAAAIRKKFNDVAKECKQG